jgi:hypothetical protein
MSRCLCKKLEGALAPFFAVGREDCEDYAIDAGHIHKSHHWSGPPSDFDKASFNCIGRPQFAPERLGKL